MDRAGWHIASDLVVPANLTPLFLSPYSPELNAIERVWLYLRERFLSHRLRPSYGRHPRGLLCGSERPGQRDRSHPLPLRPRAGYDGQFLVGMV
jgi:transposase